MSRKLREGVLKLIEEKERLENEIKELSKILKKNNVGMDDSLVDEEGYPLANVDIYQVRHARHEIICKQNDHKAIMKKIEEGISEYYDNVNVQTTDSVFLPQVNISADVPENVEPFARIHVVNPGSPADDAGIRDGDMLVEFGSVNSKNFRNVSDIATIARHSIGHRVAVKLKRNGHLKKVAIVPKEWTGQGLLGCHVVPL